MILNEMENEVILLRAIKELIDSLVNFKIFDLLGSDPDSQVIFKTSTHQKYFNILLVDFLSGTDKKSFVKQTTFLGGLRSICDKPHFNIDSSVSLLQTATNNFVEWLEQLVEVDTWLPSISTEARLKLSRISFIKICGNISKHNFLRSVGPATELQAVLKESGKSIELDEAIFVLADFYERFHTDIFNYHASTIVEFLNEIRWGIYEYLQPQWQRSIVWEDGDPPQYRYKIPIMIKTNVAKGCYWDLMNEVMSKPYMRRFQVTKWLKLKY